MLDVAEGARAAANASHAGLAYAFAVDDAGAPLASGLTIAVATAPRGLSLEEEIRLSKPALLYGDRVTLYSATAMMLASSEQIAHLDDDELIDFLESVSGTIPGGRGGRGRISPPERQEAPDEERDAGVLQDEAEPARTGGSCRRGGAADARAGWRG